METSGQPVELKRTVLHAWHITHQARMVGFGGWDMPVQYGTGIIREHLATRRGAGLFDVSHMGRFLVDGGGAEAFLLRMLTCNASALAPGQAQYGFLANEAGGALDDVYLYRLGMQSFLLVVNASNRDKDWTWLNAHLTADTRLHDASEEMAMIALQGPAAQRQLLSVLPGTTLPENRRNRIGTANFETKALTIARTGYTGEAVCFEIFCPAGCAMPLWQRLTAAGATACGLGARDSLRLEAGLPLYGHELGMTSDGLEIPIFANDLARFGVRSGESGDYIGRAALAAQRAEFDAIRAGTLATPLAERRLKQTIQPLAVFHERKPLRAGYRIFAGERAAGIITSGTSVPIDAGPDADHVMRPIGLALLDSDLRYQLDRPLGLQVDDGRQGRINANLVLRNLPPARPAMGSA